MAKTIKDLIAELSAIENQDQPVMYGYVLAEDMGAMDYEGDDYELTAEQFGEAIDSLHYDEDYFKATMSEELWQDVQNFMEKYYFQEKE